MRSSELLIITDLVDLGHLITDYGAAAVYGILFAIILAESGLLFGFFHPGDSLLLTAGLSAYKGVELAGGGELKLGLWVLMPLLFVAAVVGDNIGYWFGRKVGPPLFKRPQSLLFRPKYLQAARRSRSPGSCHSFAPSCLSWRAR